MVVLSIFCRRKKAERKLDEMRVVFNNLQENAINDESFQLTAVENAYCKGSASNIRKAKKSKKKQNYHEDELQGHNLLSICMSDEDYDLVDHKDGDTSMKYYVEPEYAKVMGSRKSSSSRGGKYALARSKDSQLDSAYEWDESDLHEPQPPAVPPRRQRPRRARSGVWDTMVCRSPQTEQRIRAAKQLITQSAPDLIASVEGEMNKYKHQASVPIRDISEIASRQARMTRSSTLGTVHPHRTHRPTRSRSNSRVNMRC